MPGILADPGGGTPSSAPMTDIPPRLSAALSERSLAVLNWFKELKARMGAGN